MRIISILLIFPALSLSLCFAQTVKITGLAPSYVGKTIELFEIEDYLSYRKKLIASTTVQPDSTFQFYTETDHKQKVIIQADNNYGYLYIQPDAKYDLFFPQRDKFDPVRSGGNQVELAFFNLDSLDINYKILSFQRWIDHFIGNNYYLKDVKPIEFIENLDRFKTNVEKAYKNDTLDPFFQTYVRFSIATLDNIQTAAQRNRYEKHDFYIKYTPVQYENDAYMEYISDFYQDIIPRLSREANEAVYMGVLKASPTLVMRALGSEYTLINIRIREMVMIKALSDVYFSDDYPQTNIITILDSVANHALFKANAPIARNLRLRLTELVPGGKAAPFVFSDPDGGSKTLNDYNGRHLYIHVFDPKNSQSNKELELLADLHKRYAGSIQFVSIYKEGLNLSEEEKKMVDSIEWDVYPLNTANSFWKNYNVQSYPLYVLIDAAGYIVAAPALGPTPNGQYETIDKTFFYIQQTLQELEKE